MRRLELWRPWPGEIGLRLEGMSFVAYPTDVVVYLKVSEAEELKKGLELILSDPRKESLRLVCETVDTGKEVE